jgi:hypothetical protein
MRLSWNTSFSSTLKITALLKTRTMPDYTAPQMPCILNLENRVRLKLPARGSIMLRKDITLVI